MGPKGMPYDMQGFSDAFCTAVSEEINVLGPTLISSLYRLRFKSPTPDLRRTRRLLTARRPIHPNVGTLFEI